MRMSSFVRSRSVRPGAKVAVAVAVAGATLAGVDLLYDQTGELFVIEVNAVPGWRAFTRTTGIDVADQLVQWIEEHHG